MQTHTLAAHSAFPPAAVTSVEARIGHAGHGWLRLRWRVEGAGRLVLPPLAGKGRADELWRTTCFELFLRGKGQGGYTEINLSPSERWAAYDFTARREGMAERSMRRDPVITPRTGGKVLILDASIPLADLPGLPWAVGLSAVLEEEDGAMSYWALMHRGDRPDFHDPACFAACLGPPDEA